MSKINKKTNIYYRVLNKNHSFLKIMCLIKIILKKILLSNIKKIEAQKIKVHSNYIKKYSKCM